MYLFNQYLVWFLNALYDRTNYKIYAQLMKSFISGPLSSVIANVDVANNAKVYPDLIEFLQSSDLDNFCQRMDPASGVILLQSVAQMLKTLIQTKGPEGHAFLIQNSADLPGYSKENMKLNLPIFIKLFDYVTSSPPLSRMPSSAWIWLSADTVSRQCSKRIPPSNRSRPHRPISASRARESRSQLPHLQHGSSS